MANAKHLAKLSAGNEVWNDWRKTNAEIGPDLSEADLKEADLTRADLVGSNLAAANLSRANLLGADLRGADLRRVNFIGAKLFGANLFAADLSESDLSMAQLRGADLTRAKLFGANLGAASLRMAKLRDADLRMSKLRGTELVGVDFTGANFAGADLEDAVLGGTTFAENDLSSAKGLETVEHLAQSKVSIDTIYRSKGALPLAFLRGVGLPETLITYMPSLVAPGAIHFYSCFISYSTKDQKFANRLYADLQNQGVRCWFAPHDVQGGKKLHEQIDDAIRMHERLLLILSQDSIASEWVKTEIRKARKRERAEKKRVLFPVRLVSFEAIRDWELFDADEGKDLATEIREYYIPDFSEWENHDPYAREFEKLLRDLRTNGANSS